MIRRVSTQLVPVAVNLYKVREAKDAGGELFRSVQKQKDQYQGIWIVSPEGKVLAAHHEFRNRETWTREVLATVDSALEAFGRVTPREARRDDPLPHRGLGVQDGGAITLAIEVRSMHQGRAEGDGVIDSLTLAGPAARSFAPPGAIAEGATWDVPEVVARRLCRVLSPASDQSTMPRPEEVTAVKLTGRIGPIEGGVARLTFEGPIAAAHTYEGKVSRAEARLTGVGTCDAKTGDLLSIALYAEGTYRMAPPYDKDLRATAGAIEWREDPTRRKP